MADDVPDRRRRNRHRRGLRQDNPEDPEAGRRHLQEPVVRRRCDASAPALTRGATPMAKNMPKALEAAGWCQGDAEDFLGMSDEERRLLDLRFAIAHTVRQLREVKGWTQKQLAERAKSSQARVAKAEAASMEATLDLMYR